MRHRYPPALSAWPASSSTRHWSRRRPGYANDDVGPAGRIAAIRLIRPDVNRSALYTGLAVYVQRLQSSERYSSPRSRTESRAGCANCRIHCPRIAGPAEMSPTPADEPGVVVARVPEHVVVPQDRRAAVAVYPRVIERHDVVGDRGRGVDERAVYTSAYASDDVSNDRVVRDRRGGRKTAYSHRRTPRCSNY